MGNIVHALGLDAIPDILKNWRKEARKPIKDKAIWITVTVLIFFGLLMIWSASMYNAKSAGNEFAIVFKQFKIALVGFVCMYLVSICRYDYVRRLGPLSIGVCFVLLLIVFLQGNFAASDNSVNGAVRGLSIGGIAFFPSEVTKIAMLIFVSSWLDKKARAVSSLPFTASILAFTGFFAFLIYMQPALSTALIISAMIMGMFFVAGANLKHFIPLCLICLGIVGLAVGVSSWRVDRIQAWLHPWECDIHGDAWQPIQSMMAIASGGFLGQGIGNGKAKLGYLPEPQNDYIFSNIAEELGFLGCVTLILVFVYLIYRIFRLALHAPDRYSRYLCAGFGILLFIQVSLNIAVVTNTLPSTGIILPFISSGGSALLVLMICVGLVLNISRHAKG